MSLSIGSAAAANITPTSSTPPEASSTSGGGLAFGGQTAIAGALTAQPGSGANIVKRVLIGGALGGALGFGASFLSLPVIGGLAAPVVAAIGAGIGATLGLVSGLWSKRKARLALERQQSQQIQPGAGAAPVQLQQISGRTYAAGQGGTQVRWTQKALKRLGLYHGKITGRMDSKTIAAVKKYEVMKGAVPRGTSNPELRSVLAQDIRLARQYA